MYPGASLTSSINLLLGFSAENQALRTAHKLASLPLIRFPLPVFPSEMEPYGFILYRGARARHSFPASGSHKPGWHKELLSRRRHSQPVRKNSLLPLFSCPSCSFVPFVVQWLKRTCLGFVRRVGQPGSTEPSGRGVDPPVSPVQSSSLDASSPRVPEWNQAARLDFVSKGAGATRMS